MQITEIITDDTLQEIRSHGTADFPFEYYFDDIKKYNKQYIEWHWHREFEFLSIERGPVDCLIGTERIRLTEGTGMFINSGVIHRFESPGQGLMPNILFSPNFFAETNSAVYKKYVIPVLSSNCNYIIFDRTSQWHDSILYQLNSIYKEAHTSCFMRELHIQSLICSLWLNLMTYMYHFFTTQKSNKNTLMQSRLHLMLQFIYNKYPDNITLEDIANAANISKSEALRCFHAGVQTTPIHYLIEYRLNRAKELLVSTQNTIINISSDVGFDNISHFTHLFTKTFGLTPREFRKQSQSNSTP